MTFGDGDVEPALGLFGGGDGGLNRIELNYPDGQQVVPTSKDLITGVPLGTDYLQIAGGGGGYGDPMRRPAETVAVEVRNGIISSRAARDLYGVVVDADSGQLDLAATRELRGS